MPLAALPLSVLECHLMRAFVPLDSRFDLYFWTAVLIEQYFLHNLHFEHEWVLLPLCISFPHWISDTFSQGYTNYQSLVKVLPGSCHSVL